MTGEPCNGKLFSTVRRETHGKGQQCTSPGVYPTALPLERRLKNQKNGPRLCPICQKKVASGYSVDVQRALLEKAAPQLATRQGKRRPMSHVL